MRGKERGNRPCESARASIFQLPRDLPLDSHASLFSDLLNASREAQDSPETSHKVVLIAGIGCAQDVWENEVEFMRKNCKLKGGLSICTFDNRGIGRSTCPLDKSEYSIDKVRLKDTDSSRSPGDCRFT